ncbi:MAG: hypothetical protein L3K16_06130 [Thermoplasmata archaeon]|nr:hypothetical protein [Thermoplasmata archaeon]
MTPRLLATGAIVLAVGLMLSAVVAEWFAAFDACLASASCVAPGSAWTLTGFLGLLAAGVLLSVAGAIIANVGFRTERAEPHGVAS